ncbi:radical SAM/SPASM domain-containing protein [Hyalangium minutum]|uniref:Radical SAM domain protein n=1 Tax=Hyalangium minutum TaxID=394096 RepID=A0A085WWA3_9BACT|nr:radical SAM protein [Hyalangium minutum]KFE71966.1 radical SAM domain protein [Hyalangium minutum]
MNVCGEILPGQAILQHFVAESDHLNGVSVLVATYGDTKKTSHLRLEVLTEDGHRLLGSRTVGLEGVYDNAFVEVFFDAQERSRGNAYVLRVTSEDASHGNAATLYLIDGPERIPGHTRCRVGEDELGAEGLFAKLSYATPTVESSVPPNLEISTVTQCNLNCVHCISRETRKQVKRLPPHMRAEISGWAREGKLRTTYADFSGDVLWADQRYGGELDFLLSLDVPFHLDTNGALLTAEVADRLLKSRITSINVSLDAAEDATYRRIRRGAPPLETVLGNMRTLVARRELHGRRDVALSTGFVLMRSNIEELPRFVELTHGAGFDTVRAIHLQAYTEDMVPESLWFHQTLFNTQRELAIEAAQRLGVTLFIDRPFCDREPQVGTSLCRMPWEAAYLLGNGDVLACCVPGLKMGNLHEQTMEEIWNGERYRELRRTVNSDQRPAACRACPFHRKTNNPLSYMPCRSAEDAPPAPTQ